MKCPFCGSENLKIIDTRKYDTVVIRVRFCVSCFKGFPTQEEVINTPVDSTIISTIIPK